MIQLVQLQDSQRVLDLQLKLTSRADHYGLRRTQCSPQDFLKGYWGLHNHIFLGYIIIMSQEPVMQKWQGMSVHTALPTGDFLGCLLCFLHKLARHACTPICFLHPWNVLFSPVINPCLLCLRGWTSQAQSSLPPCHCSHLE